jgi:autotransporter-associated beta strand protein
VYLSQSFFGSLTISGNATTVVSGVVAESTTNQITYCSLVYNGTGTLVLDNSDTYSGGTVIGSGTVQFGQTTAWPTFGSVRLAGGATLAINAGGPGEFTAATSGAGSIGGALSAASWYYGSALGIDTTNAPGGTLSYTGVLTGIQGLSKLGSGTLNLTAANSYFGATTVNNGTLALTGSLASGSAVTVGNTSTQGLTPTLSGNGTVNGPLTVSGPGAGSAGHLSPGSGVSGAFTAANLVTLGANAELDYYFGVTGSSHSNPGISSMVVLTSGASLVLPANGGTVTLDDLSTPVFTGSGSYELFSYAPGDTITNFVGTDTTYIAGPNANLGSIVLGDGFPANEQYALVNDTTAYGIFLDFTPAPEPATLLMLACGGLLFLPRRKARQRKA